MKKNTELKLGVAKVDITPVEPIPLAGFASRVGNFEGVVRPLFARFFIFEESGIKFLLITADLLWWGQSLVQELQQHIEENWGIPSDHVFLHATHNHSGPQTSNAFVPSLGKYDHSFVERLKLQVYTGIDEALQNLEPVFIEVGVGKWFEGINRRKVINGKCEMAPNYDGANDQTVTVIRYSTNDKTPKGILVHATCHPTTTGDNFISSEYPGVVMEKLESQNPNTNFVSGFLQGYCGNIRPALIKNDVFFRGDDYYVRKIGLSLYNEVQKVLEINMKPIPEAAIKVIRKSINLPFLDLPEHEEIRKKRFKEGVYKEWAQALLESDRGFQTNAVLQLSYIQLAENLWLLGSNAEMVVEYGIAAKEIFKNMLLPIGYTNGMIGYIPNEKQLAEGGYESLDSTYYFVLPSQFSPQIETIINEAVIQLREESSL